MPERLLTRTLTILILPVLLVQLATGIVFWNRHWSDTTITLAHNIAANVAAIVNIADFEDKKPHFFEKLQKFSKNNFSIDVTQIQNDKNIGDKNLSNLKSDLKRKTTTWAHSVTHDYLEEALASKLTLPFAHNSQEDTITIWVKSQKYIYAFKLDRRRLIPSTTSLMIWWQVGAPLFFILIAGLFMRNQVRPLLSLADVVSQFGKGRDVSNFKPSGALEVRRVGQAFQKMRSRIHKQITQRTEMLAGISHDLKTPLTRMHLELALQKESDSKNALLEDIKEMKKMLEEYLNFAKGEGTETAKSININEFLREFFTKFPQDNISLASFSPLIDMKATLRPYALKRALENIMSNALRYGKHVWFKGEIIKKDLVLIFEDDGPGIPENRRDDVFRPFVRLDDSRNTTTGGYGLGLSICKDIINVHGGSITLENSKNHLGLKVVITLPL